MLLRRARCTCRQLLQHSYQRISYCASQSSWPTEFALAFRANTTDDRSKGLLATAEFHSVTTAALQGNDTRFEMRQRVLRHQCTDHGGVQSHTIYFHGREGVVRVGHFAVCLVCMHMNTFFLRLLRGPNDRGVRAPDLYATGIIALLERENLCGSNRLSREQP